MVRSIMATVVLTGVFASGAYAGGFLADPGAPGKEGTIFPEAREHIVIGRMKGMVKYDWSLPPLKKIGLEEVVEIFELEKSVSRAL